MNKTFDDSPKAADPADDRVLIWQMPDAEDCGLSIDLMAVNSIDRADSRSDFVLRLAQRKHLYAVVVTSHPFNDEIRLLRQFLARLPNCSPIVLVLTDCPYPMMGIEREFFAVANLNEPLADLHSIFNETAQRAASLRDRLPADEIGLLSGMRGPQESMLQSGMHLRTRLAAAAKQSIVSVTGEVGTAKSLLVKLLHEARGGTDQNCVTFYPGTDTLKVIETIKQIADRTCEPCTFVMRDPVQRELTNTSTTFDRLIARFPDSKAQLVIVAAHPAHAVRRRGSAASLDLMPLRQNICSVREIVVGIITVYARQMPELRISIEPEAFSCLENEDWPGNVCQLNLTLAGAVMSERWGNHADSANEIVLTAASITKQINSFSAGDSTTQENLRAAYQAVCERFSTSGISVANRSRKILNDCLLENAGLVLRTNELVSQLRRAA